MIMEYENIPSQREMYHFPSTTPAHRFAPRGL